MYSFGFIIEQTLGHRTHTKNLQRTVASNRAVAVQWGLVEWETENLAARLPIYRSNWTVRAALRARRQIATLNRAQRLDALFIHTQVPAMFSADWMGRIPTVISLDATPLQYDALGTQYGHTQQSDWIEMLKWRFHCSVLSKARHLVTWSAWTKNSLVADYGIPTEQITVIPPGVNTQLWPQALPKSALDRPADNRVRILFVGGDFVRKGGEQLLRVFQQLCQNRSAGQQIELHIVTPQLTQQQLALYANVPESNMLDANVIIHNDMQPNSSRLRELFQQCDIFCLPTTGDCLPMVLAEAASTGLPLVATNVGAISEIVRDGETGLLVEPGNDEALGQALRQLVDDSQRRTRYGKAAAALIRKEHDVERNTANLLTLLMTVAEESTLSTERQAEALPGTLSPAEEGK